MTHHITLLDLVPITLDMFVLAYIGYLYLVAWMEVKATPRETMFLCDKHGPLRRNELIKFLDIDYCPICFHEKLSQAEGQFGAM